MFKNSIFAFVLFAVVFNAYGLDPKQIAEHKFANIVLKSSSQIEGSPQRSMQCFAVFVPQLNELTERFEAEFEACMQRSNDARSVIEEEVQSDRNTLENSAIQVCGGFQTCSTKSESSLEFFECYSTVAGETTRTAFNIQNTANDKAEYIRMRFTTIQFDQTRCTDESSRTYLEDSATIYSELDRCLNGLPIEPTTPAESTTISTTVEDTTTPIPTPPGGF